MTTLSSSPPFTTSQPPRAAHITSTGEILALAESSVLVFSPAGELHRAHAVDSWKGTFGETSDGTPWLATPSSVYLFDLAAGEVQRFDGTAPVGGDAEELTIRRAQTMVRVARADGAVKRTVDIPLRKALVKANRLRFEAVTAAGERAFFIDAERGELHVVNVVDGSASGPTPIDVTGLDRFGCLIEPTGRRLAVPHGGGVRVFSLGDGATAFDVAGPGARCAASGAGLVVKLADHAIYLDWDGEEQGRWEGKAIRKHLYEILALDAEGTRAFCVERRGSTLREPVTGERIAVESRATDVSGAEAAGGLGFGADLGAVEDARRVGERWELRLPGGHVQWRSADGATILARAHAKPPHEGAVVTGDAIWRWSMSLLQVVSPSGTETILRPEHLSHASAAGDRLLVLARHHDGAASAIYDTTTREATPVGMRPSEKRQHVSLAPDASYAVTWEDLRDLAVHPECGARSRVKHRHEDVGLRMLRFSASGDRFAYVTEWERLYTFRRDGEVPERVLEQVDGQRIRACAFDGETLWVAAGDGLYREQDGALALQAEPGPISRICVDGDRLVCVLRGGLIAIPKS